jgi:ketosteroid isomerase-like protein
MAADRAAAADAKGLQGALASDAVVLLPGENVLRGRANYARVIPRMAAAPVGSAAWTPVHAVVSRGGDFGCTTGVLHLVPADSTKPSTGRYANCWRKASNGAWQLVAHSQSPTAPQVKVLPDSIPGAPGSIGTGAPKGFDAAGAMVAADRAFAKFSADSGGPAGAFSRWIAEDGVMLAGRVPPRGPEQMKRAFGGFPATGKFEWGPIEVLPIAASGGDLGFTVGEARLAPTPEAVNYTKYLTVWRREKSGEYRFIFDIGSDRPAPGSR